MNPHVKAAVGLAVTLHLLVDACPPAAFTCPNGTIVYPQGPDCSLPPCGDVDMVDCWEECKDDLAGCSFCGDGKACCRLPGGWFYPNHAICGRAQNGFVSGTQHVCTDIYVETDDAAATAAPLLNAGVNCWEACGEKGGFCSDFCGYGNACCKLGDSTDPSECKAALIEDFHPSWILHSYNFHQCVTPRWNTPKFWRVSDDANCQGKEVEREQCSDLEPCSERVQIDCEFSNWAEWVNNQDGTGLLTRSRTVKQYNNEFGAPCDGALTETMETEENTQEGGILPCKYGEWSAWTECDYSGQKFRKRDIFPPSCPQLFGARPCVGPTQETVPCNVKEATDCVLSEWSEWSPCTTTCGVGKMTSYRSVLTHSTPGGVPCSNATMKEALCNQDACESPRPCLLGEWGDWIVPANGPASYVTRERDVVEGRIPLSAEGGCNGSLVEAIPHASTTTISTCPPQDWADWHTCDKPCGGGQRFRTRGTCLSQSLPFQEVEPCNTDPCVSGENCQFSAWGEWAKCDVPCGTGQSQRTRTIAQERSDGGEGCFGPLTEVGTCQAEAGPCVAVDCEWGVWEDWSACTCTCGGGTQMRSRSIKTAPQYGGNPCNAQNKSEIVPCATQSCDPAPQDMEWNSWEPWSTPCSKTCGVGYHHTSRTIKQEASHGGKVDSGLENDFQVCEGLEQCQEDTPCEFSDWEDWSACTGCFGITQRMRRIASMAQGLGQECEGNMTEVKQCNPDPSEWSSPPEVCEEQEHEIPVCVVSDWSEWGPCSESCDGGTQTRNRYLLTTPCRNPFQDKVIPVVLEQVIGCSAKPCDKSPESDCEVGDWGDWSACTRCGDARYRNRVLTSTATMYGDRCKDVDLREVGTCKSGCEHVYKCIWDSWQPETECTPSCGAATRKMSRSLYAEETLGPAPSTIPDGVFIVAEEESGCFAKQEKLEACPRVPCSSELGQCVPEDCEWGAWTDWKFSDCGLVEHSRVRTKFQNECGQPCTGPLVETREDPNAACSKNVSFDCEFGEWSAWTHCTHETDQRQRWRSIEVHAFNKGKACDGPLKETEGCGHNAEKDTPCLLSEWTPWGPCREVCKNISADYPVDNTGCPTLVRERVRSLLAFASGDGEPCSAPLDEVQACARPSIFQNPKCYLPSAIQHCSMEDWTEWSTCGVTGETRTRAAEAENGPGECSCSGDTAEVNQCQVNAVDCVMSDWQYAPCLHGQQILHRMIHVPSSGGGKPCPEELSVILPCRDESTPVEASDCHINDWADWSACSTTCGTGQQIRERTVAQYASPGGKGCDAATEETKRCDQAQCTENIDCAWGDWAEWGTCTVSCAGGYQERSRYIMTYPSGTGKICEANDIKEQKECNTQSCENCIDGAFSEWEEWGICSASCVGGVKTRQRQVEVEPTLCGKPAEGLLIDYEPCNVGLACSDHADIDCEFGPWTEWSGCSASCSGFQSRSRVIAKQGAANGAYCKGDLEENQPCNPGSDEDTPAGCVTEKPICELSDWTEWGPCSVTCGPGQRYMTRSLPEVLKFGFAQVCTGAVYTTGPCADQQECPSSEAAGLPGPVDCEWSAWGDWGACTRPGGQRYRKRDIKRISQHGGKPCVDEGQTLAAMQTEGSSCPTRDLGKVLQYCSWGDWTEWSACDATCGSASHTRQRMLGYTNAKPSELRLSEDNEALQSLLAKKEQTKVRHVMFAFVGGAVSLVVFLGTFRMCVRKREHSSSRQSSVYEASRPDDQGFVSFPQSSRYSPLVMEVDQQADA